MLRDSRGSVAFRAVDDGDDALIRRLFADSRAADFAHLPGTDAAVQAIVDLQFRAHSLMLATQFPDAMHEVITAGGIAVGRIVTASVPGGIRVVDIALLAEHQGRGLGSAALSALLDHADETNQAVELSVWGLNESAIRWYLRFGFIGADTAPDTVGGWLSMSRPARLDQGAVA